MPLVNMQIQQTNFVDKDGIDSVIIESRKIGGGGDCKDGEIRDPKQWLPITSPQDKAMFHSKSREPTRIIATFKSVEKSVVAETKKIIIEDLKAKGLLVNGLISGRN